MTMKAPNPDRYRSDGTSSQHGFSLVELLVTISIIAVLLALVLPALSSARGSARDVGCLSNLRQVGIGLAAYATDFGGRHVGFSGTHRYAGGGTAGDAVGEGWMETLGGDGYTTPPDLGISGGKLWNCPRFEVGDVASYFLSARWLSTHGRSHLREEDVRVPAEFLLVADCTRPGSYAAPVGTASIGFDDVDKDDAMAESWLFAATGGVNLHGRGNAAVAAGGNAQIVSEDDSSRMSFDPKDGRVAWSDL